MEFFKDAKAVRLQSNQGKYLVASDDEKHVRQDRSGADRAARWTIDLVDSTSMLRFKSCHGHYLTASGKPFLLGATGYKVFQTLPSRLGSSVEWEPIRDGEHVKFRTRHGQFLRANGFLPPWRNSITHDVPRHTATQDWVLWKVDVVDLHVQSTKSAFEDSPLPVIPRHVSAKFNSSTDTPKITAFPRHASEKFSTSPIDHQISSLPRHVSEKFNFNLSHEDNEISPLPRLPSKKSLPSSPPREGGRTILYKIVDNFNGDGDDEEEDYMLRFSFKGTTVAELTERLETETGLVGILVFSRNPLGGKPYPMRLHLPPISAEMRVVVVPIGSRSKR